MFEKLEIEIVEGGLIHRALRLTIWAKLLRSRMHEKGYHRSDHFSKKCNLMTNRLVASEKKWSFDKGYKYEKRDRLNEFLTTGSLWEFDATSREGIAIKLGCWEVISGVEIPYKLNEQLVFPKSHKILDLAVTEGWVWRDNHGKYFLTSDGSRLKKVRAALNLKVN